MRKPVTFRLEPELVAQARLIAEAENRTLTDFVEIAIQRAIHKTELDVPPPRNPIDSENESILRTS
jgi:predicted transcriptional regulator